MLDQIAHKVIISMDVIFIEYKVQGKENDITSKKKSETTTIQVEDIKE